MFYRLKTAATLPKIFEVFAVGLGKIAASATESATFNEPQFRASLRRKFYNREANKPKTTTATGPHLPRKKFEFFEEEAKNMVKVAPKKKRPRDSESDMFDSSDEREAAKKAKRVADESPNTIVCPSKKEAGKPKEVPAVGSPADVTVISSDGNELEISGAQAAASNPLADIILADPGLLTDVKDDVKQVIFTQIYKLATHLQGGGDVATFSGWHCEHGTMPTNIQMAVEGESLGLDFKHISLFVPKDLPAVQRLVDLDSTSNPLAPPPLSTILPQQTCNQIATNTEDDGEGKEEEEEEENEEEEQQQQQEEEDEEEVEDGEGDDDPDKEEEEEAADAAEEAAGETDAD